MVTLTLTLDPRFSNAVKRSSIAKCLSHKRCETLIKSYKGEIKKIILIFSVRKSQNSNKEEKSSNSTVSTPRGHFVNEFSNQPTARLSEKLYFNWVIILVTMATPISSQVKDRSSIFTARGEDMIF